MKIYSFEYEKHSENATDDIIISAVKLYLEDKGRDSDELRISVIRDEYGKPHITGTDEIFVSVTHAEALLLVAVAPYEIGIDAEKRGRRVKHPASLSKRYFCEDEIEFLGENPGVDDFVDMWVKKEALSKLIGRGVPCMREMSVFSDKVVFESISHYDGYVVYSVKYSDDQ